MTVLSRDEWNALTDEPMTRERYEALCSQYGLPVATDRECWGYADFEYGYTDGNKPPVLHRLRQLRAVQWQQECAAARTARDQERLAERQRQQIAAFNAAVAEREALDRGY